MLFASLFLCAQGGCSMPGPSGPRFETVTVVAEPRWQLTVRPLDPFGTTGAEYEMLSLSPDRPGDVAWKATLPYVMSAPVVSERGWTYGSAVLAPIPSPPDRSTTLIVGLDASGTARFEERLERDEHARPSIRTCVPFESSSMLAVLAVTGPGFGAEEEWWFYDLKSGKRAAQSTSFVPVRDSNGTILEGTVHLESVRVPERPLLLTHALRNTWSKNGDWRDTRDRWDLFDLEGRRVWSIEEPASPHRRTHEAVSDAAAARRALRARVTASTMEIEDVRAAEVIRYEVDRASPDTPWVVTERSRVPSRPTHPQSK